MQHLKRVGEGPQRSIQSVLRRILNAKTVPRWNWVLDAPEVLRRVLDALDVAP